MTTEELKKTIEQQAGVPAHLLKGETAEEIIAQAKALLAYKKEHEPEQPQSTRQQFAAWMQARDGIEPQDTAAAALAEIEETARRDAGGYPRTQDAGEVTGLPDGRSAKQQFAEWIGQQMAFDPFKDGDGWQIF